MSQVERMEAIEADIQEPLYDGSYRPAIAKKFAWMCLDCGLVWPMKHQAADCEFRKHVDSYVQEYWTNGFDPVTGKPNPPTLYPRFALRREKIVKNYTVKKKGYLFHVVRDPAFQAARTLKTQTEQDEAEKRHTAPSAKRARMRDLIVWIFESNIVSTNVFVTHEQAAILGLKPPRTPRERRANGTT